MTTGESQRYRFDRWRRGVIGSLSRAAFSSPQASPERDPVELLERHWCRFGAHLALLAVAFCFWPVSGRAAGAWLPIVGRHAAACSDVKSSVRPPAGRDKARSGRAAEADSCTPGSRTRDRASRCAVPGRDDRRAQGPSRPFVHRDAGRQVTSFGLLAPEPSRRPGKPAGAASSPASPTRITGEPDPVARAHRAGRRR